MIKSNIKIGSIGSTISYAMKLSKEVTISTPTLNSRKTLLKDYSSMKIDTAINHALAGFPQAQNRVISISSAPVITGMPMS